MKELIKITRNENGQQLVSARELYEFLGATERFSSWLERYCKYGFEEDIDYTSVKSFTVVNNGAKKELQDYAITIDMAKEFSMLQKSDKGKEARRYFIECERKLVQVSKKALLLERIFNGGEDGLLASKELAELRAEEVSKPLIEENKKKEQIITELKPKADYTDIILKNPGLVTITQISKDYGMSGRKMNSILNELHVQYKLGNQWLLYSEHQSFGYTQSETYEIVKKRW